MSDFYRLDRISETGAQYMIITGQRANGKSYAVKEQLIRDAFYKREEFLYLRRYDTDIKEVNIERYFGDMAPLIKDITGGTYEAIKVYRGDIFFSNWDPDKKRWRRDIKIGSAAALNMDEHLKSQMFPGISAIVYEEFVTRNGYLIDEPRRLMELVSTIARRRSIRVYMVGNLISRVCPYYSEWGLQGVRRMQPGSIKTFKRDNTLIAVEYCASAGYDSNMYHGRAARSIMGDEYETNARQHLPAPYDEYHMLYELGFEYMGFSFVLQLLSHKQSGECILFIYPTSGTRRVTRWLKNEVSVDGNTTPMLDNRRRPEALIADLLKHGKIAFSDDLTGEDFIATWKLYQQAVIHF